MPRRHSTPRRLIALALAATPLISAAIHPSSEWETHSRSVKRSNTVTASSALDGKTFDYVIVGGGTAGLVLAARLSENSTATVAVIEAGDDGSAVEDLILAPAQAYFGGIATMTSTRDWHFMVDPQVEMGGREIYWPRGKVLGGSSAVNGNYMVRASKAEHDSWASLNPGSNTTWGWDAIYPYMKKSENWTAPSDANIKLAGMVDDASLHGLSGPIHHSYPGFFYPQVGDWISTFASVGVPTRDPGGGEVQGAFIATSSVDPTTYIRSYSKNAYLDPASTRANLVVLTGFTVTNVNFNGTTATGVSFQADSTGSSFTVSAAQEVILCAGVIGSPQLLQLSGIGDATLLTSLGINVVVDLPGVGMHLTDHLSGELSFNTTGVEYTGDAIEENPAYAAAELALWKTGNISTLYNSPNDAVAYINLTTLFGEADAATFLSDVTANQSALVAAYSNNSFIQAGYNATYSAEVREIFPSAIGQAEILMSNTGTYGAYGNGTKTISIEAAIQHPLSRGSNSTSVFDNPVIDAGYLTHPADIQILRQAFKFARMISQTAPLSNILITELSPGAAVSTDAEWEAWIRARVSTEYHPAGTASMLPLELGGVVDAALRVHGTSNLRVVDAAIVPISLSAHMVAPLYGIAEAACEIIANSDKDSSTFTSGANAASGTLSSTLSSAAASSTVSSTSKKSAASNVFASISSGITALVGAAFFLAF